MTDSTVNRREENKAKREKISAAAIFINTTVICVITIIYVLLGAFKSWWHPAWLLFLLIPIVDSVIKCIKKKNITKFAFPVVCALVYLCFGIFAGNWHPSWVVFLTIPVFYGLADVIRKFSNKNK